MQKENIEKLQNKLLIWYAKNGRRNLPWRNLNNQHCDERLKYINRAYAVYISEIMLQQTQVKTVLEKFYFPFLNKFPDLYSLANATEEEILKAWQGLGYYSRARNLQLSARQCLKHFNGNIPKDLKSLKQLKGIGNYTAGAIACFGYDEKTSFVDGNIKRVISRLFSLSNPSSKELEDKAQSLLNLKDSFNHNQALLDLGALICTTKQTKCNICPFNEFCQGKSNPQLYPQKKQIKYESLDLNLFLLEYKNKFAVQKSTDLLYKGMYNFPFNQNNITPLSIFIGKFKHNYTKYKIQVNVYYQKLSSKNKLYKFKSIKELDQIALSTLSLKALILLNKYKYL